MRRDQVQVLSGPDEVVQEDVFTSTAIRQNQFGWVWRVEVVTVEAFRRRDLGYCEAALGHTDTKLAARWRACRAARRMRREALEGVTNARG